MKWSSCRQIWHGQLAAHKH